MRNYISKSNKRGGNHVLLFISVGAFLLSIFTGSSLKAQEQENQLLPPGLKISEAVDDYSNSLVNHQKVLQKRDANSYDVFAFYDEKLKNNEEFLQMMRDYPDGAEGGRYFRVLQTNSGSAYKPEDRGVFMCTVEKSVDETKQQPRPQQPRPQQPRPQQQQQRPQQQQQRPQQQQEDQQWRRKKDSPLKQLPPPPGIENEKDRYNPYWRIGYGRTDLESCRAVANTANGSVAYEDLNPFVLMHNLRRCENQIDKAVSWDEDLVKGAQKYLRGALAYVYERSGGKNRSYDERARRVNSEFFNHSIPRRVNHIHAPVYYKCPGPDANIPECKEQFFEERAGYLDPKDKKFKDVFKSGQNLLLYSFHTGMASKEEMQYAQSRNIDASSIIDGDIVRSLDDTAEWYHISVYNDNPKYFGEGAPLSPSSYPKRSNDLVLQNKAFLNTLLAFSTDKAFYQQEAPLYTRSIDEKFDPKATQGKVVGHFTQYLWEDTTRIGCADILDIRLIPFHLTSCQYFPSGNINGLRIRNTSPPENYGKKMPISFSAIFDGNEYREYLRQGISRHTMSHLKSGE